MDNKKSIFDMAQETANKLGMTTEQGERGINITEGKNTFVSIRLDFSQPLLLRLEQVPEWMRETSKYGESEDEYIISFVEMTEEEYKTLPEHKGF